MAARRRRDVRAVRRRRSASIRRTTPSSATSRGTGRARRDEQVPAAAQLPSARDLPPPGAQAGRRRARRCSCAATSSRPTCSAATSTTTTRSPPATRHCRRACRRSWPPRSDTPTWRCTTSTESLYLDIADTHGNTVDGAHIANVGGVWAGARARVRRRSRHRRATCASRPACRPAGRAMRFRLHRRGSDIAIALDPDGATVTVESGGAVPIGAGDTVTMVAAGGSLRVPAPAPDRVRLILAVGVRSRLTAHDRHSGVRRQGWRSSPARVAGSAASTP